MSHDDELTGVVLGVLVAIAAIILAVWLVHSEYRDCMETKHDEIVCTTYINSFF